MSETSQDHGHLHLITDEQALRMHDVVSVALLSPHDDALSIARHE